MPRRPSVYERSIEAPQSEPVNAAETVVVTSTPISTDTPGAQVWIEAACNILQGATGTAALCRVRRGGLTGAVVGKPITYQIGAGLRGGISVQAVDEQAGEIASQVYVLTVECTGATTNPVVTGATISVSY